MPRVRLRSYVFALSATFLGVFTSAPALADTPPPTECTDAPAGQSCTSAGPNADQDGVCVQATCVDYPPTIDGGRISSCEICLIPGYDAGSGMLNACEQFSGVCVPLGPNNCPNGQVLPMECGLSADTECCFTPPGPAPEQDAGPSPDGGSPQSLKSSSGCSVPPGGSSGELWVFGLGAVGLAASLMALRRRS